MDLIKIFPLLPTLTSQMFLPILICSGTCNCWLFSVVSGMCIYNKLYIISEWRVNYWWVWALRKSDTCILFYFPLEINSAMCLWKIWGGNNCGFATRLDAVLLCRIGFFFCCSCHAEEHFLMWPRYQADIHISRCFCCCQVILIHLNFCLCDGCTSRLWAICIIWLESHLESGW